MMIIVVNLWRLAPTIIGGIGDPSDEDSALAAMPC